MGVEYRYDQDTNTKVTRLDTDYTTGRATNLDYLDQSISSTESDIRGVDNDTLKTLSDQLDNVESAVAIINWTDVTDIKNAVITEVADILADTAAIDARLPSDPADQSVTNAYMDTIEDNIRGVSNRDLTEVYNLINTSSNPFQLTTYTTKTGSPVAYVDATWVDIYSSGALTKDTEITGIMITNSGGLTGDVFRITLGDGTTKVFPYGASNTIGGQSGKLQEFQFPVRIPSSETYKIQVNCTSANARTATLTELDVIEVG